MTSVCTVILEVATKDGTATWRRLDRVDYQCTPADSFVDQQPGRIPVDVGHDGVPVGWVDYLEHKADAYNGALMAVGVVNAGAELVDGLFCSPEIRCDAMHSIERHSYRLDRRVNAYGQLTATRSILEAVGIVSATAGVTATRIRAFDGDYRTTDWSMMKAHRPPPILDRAKAAASWELRSRRPDTLPIHGRPARTALHDRRGTGPNSGPPRRMQLPDGTWAPIEYHGGGYVIGVR